MALRKTKVVDGYTAFRAAQRASKKGPKTRDEQPQTKPPAKKKPESRKSGVHIGRTVLPTRHEIVCYECGYAFQLTGRAQSTFCPKCRTVVDMIDYTIDTEWTETLKTGGTITVTADAVLKSGEIMATDIILEGTVEEGTLRAVGRLVVRPTAVFPEQSIRARDLQVCEGTSLVFKRKATFRDVLVEGQLRGRIHSSGVVTVKAGALLRGEIYGEHLVVEEGAGLKARMRIQASEIPAEEPRREFLEKTA